MILITDRSLNREMEQDPAFFGPCDRFQLEALLAVGGKDGLHQDPNTLPRVAVLLPDETTPSARERIPRLRIQRAVRDSY